VRRTAAFSCLLNANDYPRLAAWAAFFRRFAALPCDGFYSSGELGPLDAHLLSA